jgi:hypothetical protein
VWQPTIKWRFSLDASHFTWGAQEEEEEEEEEKFFYPDMGFWCLQMMI